MIHANETPGTNQYGCLSLAQDRSLEKKVHTGIAGACGGFCVSAIAVAIDGSLKKVGLGVACSYCGIGALAGAVVAFTASNFVCHECSTTSQSTDNNIPPRSEPITTESLHMLPSTQAIVQQPEERALQTIVGGGYEPTPFDPPPPYSAVVHMGYPPPSYQEVAGERV